VGFLIDKNALKSKIVSVFHNMYIAFRKKTIFWKHFQTIIFQLNPFSSDSMLLNNLIPHEKNTNDEKYGDEEQPRLVICEENLHVVQHGFSQ